MPTESAQSGPQSAPRFDSLSAVGLAAIVAALHVAVLAGRVSTRNPRGRCMTFLVWQQPDTAQVETSQKSDRVPSNPMQAYNAGRLALTSGMAVISLAFQMQVMRMGAALSR